MKKEKSLPELLHHFQHYSANLPKANREGKKVLINHLSKLNLMIEKANNSSTPPNVCS